MGLFSKEECCFCGNKVGMLSRKKLTDKNYICKDCEKNCSAFIEVSRYDKAFLENHMAYMKKQDELYKKEFEPLDKSKKEKIIGEAFHGIVFADEIAMFEVIDPKAEKRNYKELFRYDQIRNYKVYVVENTGEGKKYSEIGVEINLRCKIAIVADEKLAHPYVETIKIPCGKNVDNTSRADYLRRRFDQIFGKESDTVLGSIKESIIGKPKERQQVKFGVDALKGLGSLAKAGLSGNAEDKEKAKEQMKNVAESGMNLAFDNQLQYTKTADSAEKRAWGE